MRRITFILTATLLIAFLAMALRGTVLSPPNADEVRQQIVDYSTARAWTWEKRSRASSSNDPGWSLGRVVSKAFGAADGRTDGTVLEEYEFSDGTGLIVVRMEHAGERVKQIEITCTGAAAGSAENLQRHLKAQPGLTSCRILSRP